jgi:hypothetical protein
VVFAVWEPMLATDWSKPGTSALQRLNDGRTRQFWDPTHLVAWALKKAEAEGNLHPDCCQRKGVLWDLIAAYAPGAMWREIPPEPVLFNGTVVRTAGDLDAMIVKSGASGGIDGTLRPELLPKTVGRK